MTFVGKQGGAAYPKIKRAKLIDGETYLKHGPNLGLSPMLRGDAERSVSHWKQAERGSTLVNLSSTNIWGLTSRSESMFPEAFKPVDTKFWVPMSQEERSILVAAQAAANAKATFDDESMALASTAADEQYMEAQGRRNQSMRRRKKPRNYDERQKDEQLQKELPLARKYTGPAEAFYRDSSAIVKTGPLDTPILAQGLPVFGKAGTEPQPKVLKAKRGRRRRVAPQQQQTQGAEVGLPTFSLLAAPKARLIRQESNNPHGLKSRSEMMYPEAYADISTIFWRNLSDEERGQIMTVQARAMEKVGYESGTTKYFTEEIFDDGDFDARRSGRTDDTAGGGRLIDTQTAVVLLLVLVFIAVMATRAMNVADEAPGALSVPSSTADSDFGVGD